MGWLFFPRPSGKSTREILESEALRWRLDEAAHPKIVGYTENGSFHAFAVRFPAAYFAAQGAFSGYKSAPDGSVTTAICFLTKNEGGEFGYKGMDETCGPNAVVKSGAFLNLLSETTVEYALDWRRRCREAIAIDAETRARSKDLTDGARIRLQSPLKFQDGVELSELTVIMVRRRGRNQRLFKSDKGMLYRIPSSMLAGAVVV